jgi:hypothetical protein
VAIDADMTARNGARPAPGPRRTLVLVAGSGRSGTSLFSGILQRLGFLVPAPEVPADPTNPRGFAESQWVVDLHTRLLRGARVQVSDARPAAWALTARCALDPAVQRELRDWLELQFGRSPDVIVKDPRLSWLLPLWRRCAADVGAAPRCVTMLRHPAAVIDSKHRWYGASQGDVARVAGWINQTLFTERATRELPRAFVHYEQLLDDWPSVVARVGEEVDLAAVRDAPAAAIRAAHEYLDRGLSRSRGEWGDLRLPPPLRAQADAVWEQMSRLGHGEGADGPALRDELDALRAAYREFYADAEAVAQSSIAAARGRAPAPRRAVAPAVRLARRVPLRYRHSVPPGWRVRIARALGAPGPSAR